MPAKPLSPEQDRLLRAVRDELRRLTESVDERRMFGGITLMVNGNMLCCVARQGLMVRVGAAGEADALAHSGVQRCMGAGRPMVGFVMVDHAVLNTPQEVTAWLRRTYSYVKTLPPKPAGKAARLEESHS